MYTEDFVLYELSKIKTFDEDQATVVWHVRDGGVVELPDVDISFIIHEDVALFHSGYDFF